ncbi:MAG TPA: DUF342 domain-containing protein [Clostridiaceae bacterium]|nr:DUF342 domain-containing protein [Clostridiaceae bacterium]
MPEHTSNNFFSDNKATYSLDFKDDGVYLTVFNSQKSELSAEVNEIISKLLYKGIKNYEREVIIDAIKSSNSKPVKIVTYEKPGIIRDATAKIILSLDKMQAFVVLSRPEGGKPLGEDDLLKLLSSEGVVHGIKKEVIQDLGQNPVYDTNVLVAEGDPPVNGRDGKVIFHFDLNRNYTPIILEDGNVDFRNLNIIETVTKGQKLCTIVPPTEGIPGKTVTGNTLKALNGKKVKIPKGKNVELSEDELSLIASIDGQVQYLDGKVSVFATYEVPADVDNSTGNIKFIGNVVVRGNVLSGFEIEAGGFVEVWGVVEGAVIKAGADIIIRRGVHGLGKGYLEAGGDVVSTYIENSTVNARNNIKADAIMHSQVRCGNRIELSGRKGLLVGGSAKAGKAISAKVIGSIMATATEIEVGMDPNLKERYKALRDESAQIQSDLKKTSQVIELLQKLQGIGPLPPEKSEMLSKSIRTRIFLNSRLNVIKSEIAEIEEKMQEEARGTISVYNFLYPGTSVTIGSCKMFVKENLQFCTLYRDGADIRIGPYRK